jgi:hypothetical protein
MKMAFKIVIWGLSYHVGLFLLRNIFDPSSNIGMSLLIMHALLFCVYLALLGWEIRTRIRNAATQRQLRWTGFLFTFCVGFLWWMPFASSLISESSFYNPSNILEYFTYLTISGIIFGVIGMAMTQYMVLFVFKQPEQL